MKKIIKRLLGLITALVVSFSLAYAFSAKTEAANTMLGDNTATASSYATYTLEVYDKDDYDILMNFDSVYGIDYATLKMEVQAYEDMSSDVTLIVAWDEGDEETYEDLGLENADTWWTGGYVNSTKTATWNYNNHKYAYSGTTNTTDKNSEAIVGAGLTYAQAKEAVEKYESVAPLTSVKKDQEIVIAAYLTLTGGTGLIQNAAVVLDDMGGVLTTISPGSYVNSNFNSTYPASTSADANSTTVTNGRKVGGAMSKATSGLDATTKLYLGALAYKVNTTGTLTLDLPVDSDVEFTDTGSVSANLKSNPNYFSFTQTSFTIKSDKSSDPSLSKVAITVGATTTNVTPSATTDNYATEIQDSAPSGTASATDTTASITTTSTDGATVTGMWYGTSSTGPWTTTSGSVTLGNPGTSTYVKITTVAEDNNTTATYIVEIPKDKYTDCYLTDITSIGSNKDSDGTTTLSPTFASGTTSYTITMPKTATSLNMTVTFDSAAVADGGKAMTAKLNGSTSITSGTSFTISSVSNGSTFTIVVYAQDTTQKKTYNFTVATAETNTTLDVTVKNVTYGTFYTGGYTGVTWALTKLIEPNVAQVTVSLSNSANATIVAKIGGTIQSNPASIPIAFVSASGAETITIDVYVTAQAGGDAKQYAVEIERRDYNSCDDLDTSNTKVYAVTSSGDQLVSGTWTGDTFNASSTVDYTTTGFYVV